MFYGERGDISFVIEWGKWDSEKEREWRVALGASVVAFCGVSALNYHVPLCAVSLPSSPIFFISFSIL